MFSINQEQNKKNFLALQKRKTFIRGRKMSINQGKAIPPKELAGDVNL